MNLGIISNGSLASGEAGLWAPGHFVKPAATSVNLGMKPMLSGTMELMILGGLAELTSVFFGSVVASSAAAAELESVAYFVCNFRHRPQRSPMALYL